MGIFFSSIFHVYFFGAVACPLARFLFSTALVLAVGDVIKFFGISPCDLRVTRPPFLSSIGRGKIIITSLSPVTEKLNC